MLSTQQDVTITTVSPSTWRKSDTVWMLGLYGTAIGAGVLFLPINAGIGGLIPLILMGLLAFPMTFYAHRGLARLVLSSTNPAADITQVMSEHFGKKAGRIFTVLCFHFSYFAGLRRFYHQYCRKLYAASIRNNPTATLYSVILPFDVTDWDCSLWRGTDSKNHEYSGLSFRFSIDAPCFISYPALEWRNI